MLTTLGIIILTIFLSDIGDKTQLTIILLTNKTKKHFLLLLGILSGFLLSNTIAVVFGTVVSHLLPQDAVKTIAGIVFILFGILTLLSRKSEKESASPKIDNPFLPGLSLIFLAEFGDKSQIAAMLFATKYNPLLVITGCMIGLLLISILTIYVSRKLFSKIPPKLLSSFAGALFILLGIFFLL